MCTVYLLVVYRRFMTHQRFAVRLWVLYLQKDLPRNVVWVRGGGPGQAVSWKRVGRKFYVNDGLRSFIVCPSKQRPMLITKQTRQTLNGYNHELF